MEENVLKYKTYVSFLKEYSSLESFKNKKEFCAMEEPNDLSKGEEIITKQEGTSLKTNANNLEKTDAEKEKNIYVEEEKNADDEEEKIVDGEDKRTVDMKEGKTSIKEEKVIYERPEEEEINKNKQDSQVPIITKEKADVNLRKWVKKVYSFNPNSDDSDSDEESPGRSSNLKEFPPEVYNECRLDAVRRAEFMAKMLNDNNEADASATDESLKIFACTLCSFRSMFKRSLKQHNDTVHLKKKSYSCSNCEYKTNHKTDLYTHINGVHLKLKAFECSECHFKTSQKSNLKRHNDSVHFKKKPFKCSICGYVTSQKSHLKVHINQVHLQLRSHKCTDCEYRTNVKSHLKRHFHNKHTKLKPIDSLSDTEVEKDVASS